MSNAAVYDAAYSQHRYDIASVYDHIIRIRQRYLPPRGRVLDHGFGNGVIARYLTDEGFEVHGVETSAAACELAASRGLDRLHLIGETDRRMPFDDAWFDAIVSNQVLYFIPDREQIAAVVHDFRRILRPGGKLVATIMHPDNYWFTEHSAGGYGAVDVSVRGRIAYDYRLYRFRDDADVRGLFDGFRIDDFGYFDFRLLDVTCAKHWIVLASAPA